MPRRKKPLYTLTLNGLLIDVMSKTSLTIHDPMSNLEDGEAYGYVNISMMRAFLLQKNREIEINIVNS